MHREVTTAHSQADARELIRHGWRALKAKDAEIIRGRDRVSRTNIFGDIRDGFSALMVRDLENNDVT